MHLQGHSLFVMSHKNKCAIDVYSAYRERRAGGKRPDNESTSPHKGPLASGSGVDEGNRPGRGKKCAYCL
jgi:hypothetical protein